MIDILPILLLGLGLGMLHALDADHVMAMSMLNANKPSVARSVFFSVYWALGHGFMVMLMATLLFYLGFKMPDSWGQLAEIAIGSLLIVMGLWLLINFKREKMRLQQHRHGNIVHRHWHDHQHIAAPKKNNGLNAHQPVMVGLLHGVAGSAPAIALIPALAYGEINLMIGYLLIFSIGVMLAMLGVGLGLRYCQHVLSQHYQPVYKYYRHAIAFSSVSVGGFWLIQVL